MADAMEATENRKCLNCENNQTWPLLLGFVDLLVVTVPQALSTLTVCSVNRCAFSALSHVSLLSFDTRVLHFVGRLHTLD